MPRLSWNAIQNRAVEFAARWQGGTYEKGENQSFWSEFLTVYGIDRRCHGASKEGGVNKITGRDLNAAQLQAYDKALGFARKSYVF